MQTETTSSARRPQCTVSLHASDKVATTSVLRRQKGSPGIITIPIENNLADSEYNDHGKIVSKTKTDNEDSSTSATELVTAYSL